jgi:hypothetical protein
MGLIGSMTEIRQALPLQLGHPSSQFQRPRGLMAPRLQKQHDPSGYVRGQPWAPAVRGPPDGAAPTPPISTANIPIAKPLRIPLLLQ